MRQRDEKLRKAIIKLTELDIKGIARPRGVNVSDIVCRHDVRFDIQLEGSSFIGFSPEPTDELRRRANAAVGRSAI